LELQWILALIVAVAISGLGWKVGALSRGGALAACLVGGLTFGLGGWIPAILLVTFFGTSSLLSRWGGDRKGVLAADFAKGGRRDAAQVFANGGISTLMTVFFGLQGAGLWLSGLIGALAAVNADTWATELGVLAPARPRLLLSGRPVEPGTSGAVTGQGLLAAAGGALLIGALGGLLSSDWRLLWAGLLGGFGGALVDSLLGASVQVQYGCPACGRLTEQHPRHHCGQETTLRRGWRWLNNDRVNGLASLAGAGLAMLVWIIAPA
jgi:uncharacterized protein (TIGR00297 family)